MLVEIPFSIVAGTLYFVAWYYPIGFPRDWFTVGYAYFLMLLFELYYVSFGKAISAFAPNELLASLLVPIFLPAVVFWGVFVPYAGIPKFWRFVHWISPFKYLVSGLLSVLVHDVPVRWGKNELARFNLPPNVANCTEYTLAFVQRLGGYVEQENGVCKFCQYKDGDEYVSFFPFLLRGLGRGRGLMMDACMNDLGGEFPYQLPRPLAWLWHLMGVYWV